jgi:adenylate cyclase
MIRITYQNERSIDEAEPAPTLLQVSLRHGIPHVAECGGHARCSTCRVLVLDGLDRLTPRTEAEAILAAGRGLEPEVRLACQTCPLGPVTIRRLVMDDEDIELAGLRCHTSGKEMALAVLFGDIRDFTPFAETHLPYDVVHILNRYFRKWGDAVLRRNGYLDKYIGDGVMALFGLDGCGLPAACAAAVQAALEVRSELPGLNDYLSRHFSAQMRIGTGIHAGEVLVAEIGHPDKMQLTAIGDVVNVASRIESASRDLGVDLLVSDAVRTELAGGALLGRNWPAHLKGKAEPVTVHEVLGWQDETTASPR